MPDLPNLQAVLLCDGAMQVGRKWTLQGIFNRIFVKGTPPFEFRPFHVYLRLSDLVIRNGSKLVVEIRRSVTEELENPKTAIFHGAMDFEVDGEPGKLIGPITFDFAMPVVAARFPEAGSYDMVVLTDGDLLGIWTLYVQAVD